MAVDPQHLLKSPTPWYRTRNFLLVVFLIIMILTSGYYVLQFNLKLGLLLGTGTMLPTLILWKFVGETIAIILSGGMVLSLFYLIFFRSQINYIFLLILILLYCTSLYFGLDYLHTFR